MKVTQHHFLRCWEIFLLIPLFYLFHPEKSDNVLDHINAPHVAWGRASASVANRTEYFVRSKGEQPHLCQLFFFGTYGQQFRPAMSNPLPHYSKTNSSMIFFRSANQKSSPRQYNVLNLRISKLSMLSSTAVIEGTVMSLRLPSL